MIVHEPVYWGGIEEPDGDPDIFVVALGTSGPDRMLGSDGVDLLYGRAGDDRLRAGADDDVLCGGRGQDRLIGGAGEDRFLFNGPLGQAHADRLVDFESGLDRVQLATALFGVDAPGQIAAGSFALSSRGQAAEADDRIIFNPVTGRLFFDPDGSGAAERQLIAVLDPDSGLSAADVWLI